MLKTKIKLLRACGGYLGSKRRRKTRLVCDKLRGADNQALIRRFLNGATPLHESDEEPFVSKVANEWPTLGTETSKYQQENKSIEILLVAASERRGAQTRVRALWGCRTCIKGIWIEEVFGKAHHRE